MDNGTSSYTDSGPSGAEIAAMLARARRDGRREALEEAAQMLDDRGSECAPWVRALIEPA